MTTCSAECMNQPVYRDPLSGKWYCTIHKYALDARMKPPRPTLSAQLIEEVERYTAWLTDHEAGDYLEYHHLRIKELESD